METCTLDETCVSGGLGCNAGGVSQLCRFCGFGPFSACPDKYANSDQELAPKLKKDVQFALAQMHSVEGEQEEPMVDVHVWHTLNIGLRILSWPQAELQAGSRPPAPDGDAAAILLEGVEQLLCPLQIQSGANSTCTIAIVHMAVGGALRRSLGRELTERDRAIDVFLDMASSQQAGTAVATLANNLTAFAQAIQGSLGSAFSDAKVAVMHAHFSFSVNLSVVTFTETSSMLQSALTPSTFGRPNDTAPVLLQAMRAYLNLSTDLLRSAASPAITSMHVLPSPSPPPPSPPLTPGQSWGILVTMTVAIIEYNAFNTVPAANALAMALGIARRLVAISIVGSRAASQHRFLQMLLTSENHAVLSNTTFVTNETSSANVLLLEITIRLPQNYNAHQIAATLATLVASSPEMLGLQGLLTATDPQLITVALDAPSPPPPSPSLPPLCVAVPALGTCTTEAEMCYRDVRCSAALSFDDPYGGVGCNAGGDPNCRFCGFGRYSHISCPALTTDAAGLSADSAPDKRNVIVIVAVSSAACTLLVLTAALSLIKMRCRNMLPHQVLDSKPRKMSMEERLSIEHSVLMRWSIDEGKAAQEDVASPQDSVPERVEDTAESRDSMMRLSGVSTSASVRSGVSNRVMGDRVTTQSGDASDRECDSAPLHEAMKRECAKDPHLPICQLMLN